MITISIIILNWNGWKDTVECLESLYQINYPNYDVIVIDNHSDDDSVKKIREYCSSELRVESEFFEYQLENKPIQIFEYSKKGIIDSKIIKKFKEVPPNRRLIFIRNDTNYGFAEGNNIGIRFALKNLDSDYVLLLNNDTVVDRDFLKEMVLLSESKKEIGFVGPKIYYYDFKGQRNVINFAGGILNMWIGKSRHLGINEADNKQNDLIKRVDYINGACMLVKKEILYRVGLFDPVYFLFWEENDWCYRAQLTGFASYYAPKAKIWHKTSTSIKNSGLGEYYMIRNRIIFMKKYSNKLQFFVFLLYLFGFQIWINIISYLKHKNLKNIQIYIKGLNNGLFY